MRKPEYRPYGRGSVLRHITAKGTKGLPDGEMCRFFAVPHTEIAHCMAAVRFKVVEISYCVFSCEMVLCIIRQ